jgi:hypothetical protein
VSSREEYGASKSSLQEAVNSPKFVRNCLSIFVAKKARMEVRFGCQSWEKSTT